jgi:hypothetical protein
MNKNYYRNPGAATILVPGFRYQKIAGTPGIPGTGIACYNYDQLLITIFESTLKLVIFHGHTTSLITLIPKKKPPISATAL